MEQLKRKKRVAHSWGSPLIDCAHDVCNKNGILYCKNCGQNFMEEDLPDDQYYKLFEHKPPEFAIDHMINDIMPQEVEELEYEEKMKKLNKKLNKNKFSYSGEYL